MNPNLRVRLAALSTQIGGGMREETAIEDGWKPSPSSIAVGNRRTAAAHGHPQQWWRP
uniref:Uncharacterized protein n=1 Tax=Arundo donax TaxID=35708 RepID=A0A0A9FVH8_ARUDO